MASKAHPMAAAFEKAVADKMNMRGGSKQGTAKTFPALGHRNSQTLRNPSGTYWVESGDSTIGPYQTAAAAAKRNGRETKVWAQGGSNKGKQPETTFKPRGSKAVAKSPVTGKPVRRIPPG